MTKQILLLTAVLLLLASGCGRTDLTAASDVTEAQTISVEIFSEAASARTLPESAVSVAAETQAVPDDSIPESSVRTLPGHITSDVYVRFWDGDLSPGLRADDAEVVKQIIASQAWGDSFDNLSDTRIEAEGVLYAYETQTGILTAADDRAAKLAEADQVRLNAILAQYLADFGNVSDFTSTGT